MFALSVMRFVKVRVVSSISMMLWSTILLVSSSSRSVYKFQFGFFKFHLCLFEWLLLTCLCDILILIGMWSLLYISGKTSHWSLCAIDGELRERSMQEKLPCPRLMWVGVESFKSTRSSFCMSFSIVFPLELVEFDPQIILCKSKSPLRA